MNWAAQEVPFPRFGVQLCEDQSTEDFMDEVEKKVNALIGESTMNEYKAFKNLVKHKKRINRVFSEICGDKSFHSSRPGINKKAPAIAVASCSSRPPKTSRKSSSKKRKATDDGAPSAVVCPEKTKFLESIKRKHKSTDIASEVELQAGTGLAGLSRKKLKKVVKKVAAAEVRQVPSVFDDDFFTKLVQKGFTSWPFLRLNFNEHYTPCSENEFVDIDSFSDVAGESAQEAGIFVVAAETTIPQPIHRQDEASPEFVSELELTIHKGENPVQDVPLLETREDVPEGQDPSPFIAAFNKSFGMSYRGELLSVGYEAAGNGDGTSKILTLWKSPILINETGEGASEMMLHSFGETARDSRKGHCTPSKKTSASLGKPSTSSGKKLATKDKKGSLLFIVLFASDFSIFHLWLCFVIFHNLKTFFDRIPRPNSQNIAGITQRRLLYLEEFLANA
jgi:uncharacterized protein YktA (UPF0223 family)